MKGDCGDGYVLGFSEELEYNIWTGGAKLMKSNNKEFRIKDMIKQQLLEIVMNGDNIDIEWYNWSNTKIWCRRGLSDWTNEIDTIIFNGERESLCGLFG